MGNKIEIDWHAHARVMKYTPKQVREIEGHLGRKAVQADFESLGVLPDDITEADGNQLTTAGLTRITNLIIGGGAQAFANSRAVVGVGNSSTGFTLADGSVGTNAAGGAWYMQADSTYPSVSAGVITTNATFNTDNSQFAWNDWCFGVATAAITANAIFNTASTTGVMLNRKVQSLGTKGAGATWTLQATITLT